MINPDEFIISRKRKKYKFAKFAVAENCYELEDYLQGPTLQKGWKPDVVEIGAGTGLFSVGLAARHPTKQFVAVDVKADRLQKGAYEAIARELGNICFVRARADQISELFRKNTLKAIWLTFLDPFPRSRSARRRMTHPIYLKKYAELLLQGSTLQRGRLYLKHDDREFFCWSLEQLVAEKWKIEELSFDLHESNLLDDYKIPTTYEQRWLDAGLTTNFVSATPDKQ